MKAAETYAVAIEDLSFSYGNIPILSQVNLSFSQGSFVGIIGPNGGGKTTLLNLLMGFLKPQKGAISLFGQSPIAARVHIGYVPQFHRTDRDFPITVLDLVLLGAASKLSFWGRYPKSAKQRALQLLEELDLAPLAHAPFGCLSGGQAQKALLARALLTDPELLILDEPMANIDAPSTIAILQRLESLKRKKTILMVTHDLKTIVEKVDQIICVQRSVTSYKPEEICEHFALGLYHTPLLDIPNTHFKQQRHVSTDAR